MSDAFKPEADRLDQERDVLPSSPPEDGPTSSAPPLSYPERRSVEVPDADLLEQSQAVDDDPDEGWR